MSAQYDYARSHGFIEGLSYAIAMIAAIDKDLAKSMIRKSKLTWNACVSEDVGLNDYDLNNLKPLFDSYEVGNAEEAIDRVYDAAWNRARPFSSDLEWMGGDHD